MEELSCPGPVYRRVELFGSKESRQSRCERSVSRASSSDRRSLTPTRITQPMPRPWTATVTTGSNLYQQAYAANTDTICQQYCEQDVCQREKVCQRDESCESQSGNSTYHEEKRAYSEQVCTNDGNVHQHQQKQAAQVCKYVCKPKPCKQPPKEVEVAKDSEVTDFSKLVPPDVAVCPKGIDAEHDLYTETTEKDVGNLHIKKTTTYEKTVELVSPDQLGPSISQDEEEQTTEVVEKKREQRLETFQRSTTVDREVENISGRRSVTESAEMVTKKIDTQQLIENARKREEEERNRREEEERRIREEAERKRREDEERMAELKRRDEEERRQKQEAERKRKEEEKRRLEEEERERNQVRFSETCQVIQEERKCPRERIIDIQVECPKCCKKKAVERPPSRERIIDIEVEGRSKERIIEVTLEEDLCECNKSDKYREVVQEIKSQQSCEHHEETRRRCLREQVEVHQNLRAQQAPEKRHTLQERRLCSRLSQKSHGQETTETSCKKHVQFVQQTDSSPRPLPASNIKNATAKEWKSEMVKALTTAPDCPFSSFTSSAYDESSTSAQEVYSHEMVYEESNSCACPLPPAEPPARPISPFLEALTTAPERPYTPLGRDVEAERKCRRCESQTPTMENTDDGYCTPAQLLYTETRSKECNTTRKCEGPRPLPTPPPDYRLRDANASPCRSRPQTPSGRSVTAGLKKPDTIPSYQKFLVAMEKEPANSCPYLPSRSPTPCRAKSPAEGPPEQSTCLLKAPRVRDTPPPCRHMSRERSCTPDKSQTVRYHYEEDTPESHKRKDFTGTRSVCIVDDGGSKHAHFQEHDDSVIEECDGAHHLKKMQHVVKEYDQTINECTNNDPEPVTVTCYIKKNSSVKPTLPCPGMQGNISNKFPKTGVRVLPPTGPPEVRRIRHDIPPPKPCPETGVTVIPCRAHSDTVCKSGVVVVPCEGTGRGGICITPTPDHSGVSISPCPAQSGKICKKPSCYCGSQSGKCSINASSCDGSGVSVTPRGDGTFCVTPCNPPAVSSVKCPKPILKPPPKNLPFPQIPLPGEEPEPLCEGCPRSSQSCELGFQPIQNPRTNLGNQLTQLTLCKRDNPLPTVQLYKPQAQMKTIQCTSSSQSQFKSQTTQNQSQFHREVQTSCQTQVRCPTSKTQSLVDPPNLSSQPDLGAGIGGLGSKNGSVAGSSAPKRGKGILNQAITQGSRVPLCGHCSAYIRGPFITALGQIWCPDHFVCVNQQCRRPLQDIGFVEEKGQLYCEYCFEIFIAPPCDKCNCKIKGDCLNAIGKHFHPECFKCSHCSKHFGNNPFFLEEGLPYCENDWNDLFTTKCFACGFPVEAGDRWVEALNNNYHSQCFNCTMCKKNLEGQSFYAKAGRPFCKNHAR